MSDETIWKKLTRLFRSGPVVRHKVAAGERLYEPSGTASAYKRELSSIYVHSLASYGQYERLARYADYSEMLFTPELAQAMNIYADEVTCESENGHVVEIISKNEEIKETLETLFYEILNIDFNAWGWVKTLCKNGDFILFVDASEENGILNLLPIPINEIEREEGYDKEDPFAVRFRWLTHGNAILQNWQVIHFRLLGDDSYLPYGTSLLESARRIWRQLILIEDAMLVYRIVRSPERRVFYIDVGNIPAQDMDRHIETIKTNLNRSTIVDQSTGRVDLRYNPLSVDENYYIPKRGAGDSSRIETLPGGQFPVRRDTLIPLLDGRTITIEQLAAEFDNRKENWVHSVQDKTNAFVPGKVVWCGKNYTCNDLRRLWLDDGTYVDMAPEHPVVLRDGTKKRVDELSPGESLMPFRTRKEFLGSHDYRMIQDPTDDEWKFIHQLVAGPHGISEAHERSREGSVALHHVDFDRFNNCPDNLKWMGRLEHIRCHGENAKRNLHTPEMDARNRKRLISWNSSEDGRKLTSERNSTRWENEEFRENHSGKNHWNVKKWAEKYKEITPLVLAEFCIMNDVKLFGDLLKLPDRPLKTSAQIRMCLIRHGIKNWTEFAKDYLGIKPRNHSVLRVETLEDTDDVFCMTVIGPDGEDDRHNFALLTKTEDGTVSQDWNGVFVSNTGDIEDVQYIQSKMFSAIGIPRAYLGYEEGIGSKATLAQEDVRFAKTIERIQKLFVAELNKIAIIHLYLLGFRGEDLVNFTIQTASPSTIATQQRLELWRMKLEIAGLASEGILDKETIYKRIFNLNDEQIAKIREGRKLDKLEDVTIEAIQAPQEEAPPGAVPEEPVAGEEELPGTLGGEAGGGAPPAPPENASFNLQGMILGEDEDDEDSMEEKYNPGSEGDDALIATDKGKNLFDPAEDLSKHAFGTEKQTASDPFDKRASRRLITRPFSESTDDVDEWFNRAIELVDLFESDDDIIRRHRG